MLNVREIMCFNSNLALKMYLKTSIFFLSPNFVTSILGAPDPYIMKCFLLGSEQISRMTLIMSKTTEFPESTEVLHVCLRIGIPSFQDGIRILIAANTYFIILLLGNL